MYVSLALIGLAALSADPSSTPAPTPVAAQHSGVTPTWVTLGQKLSRALEQERFDEALALAKAMTADPGFESFSETEKTDLQYLIGVLNLQLGRSTAALPYLAEVAAKPDATAEQWLMLLDGYGAAEQYDDAARTMATVARRFPDAREALTLDYRAQFAIHPALDKDVGFDLRLALFRADWKFEHASWVWLQLIDDFIDRDRLEEARPLYARVTDFDARVQLFAMRRYDALRPAGVEPDFNAMIGAQLAAERKAASGPDATMARRNAYMQSLYALGRYEEAVAVADAAMAAPAPAEEDIDEAVDLNWIVDGRARSLLALGRIDEGLAQERLAAERPEYGGPNFNQTISLAWSYLRNDKAAEAQRVVDTLKDRDLGKYGARRVTHVQACISQALGDTAAARAGVAQLGENWRDGPSDYYDALACIGDEDAMAAAIIEVLADPLHRKQAVSWMHIYQDIGHQTPYELAISAVYDRVKVRPEVVAAHDSVARSFTLPTIVGPY
ncbi:hypothetical protein [Brevundimonas lenta]|uniref:Tetratricopeptide (TPR) repeat protein n=1 Tax=Brevundimonas lenta TaxID=424796 RepID=A0A7W6JBR2_9CAUL|nr:hypothetical protein [Brevundimonas lenta]MBB4082179.1 tetratricopeptide (TPR) repeat protein [Brevundimonas lenta]